MHSHITLHYTGNIPFRVNLKPEFNIHFNESITSSDVLIIFFTRCFLFHFFFSLIFGVNQNETYLNVDWHNTLKRGNTISDKSKNVEKELY